MFKGTVIDHLGRLIMLSGVEYIQCIHGINSCGIEAHMVSGNRLVIFTSTDKDLVDHVWDELIKWRPDTSIRPYFNVNDVILNYRISHKE